MKNLTRNLTIFLASVMLVLATNALRPSQAANEAAKEQENKYLDLLYGGDFDVECKKQDPIQDVEERDEKEIDVDEVDTVVEKYHEVINCLFNKRIKVLVEKMKMEQLQVVGGGAFKPLTQKELDEIYQLLSPPPLILDQNSKQPIGRKDCEPVNNTLSLSTYCLATYAVDEYFLFREAMIQARALQRGKAADLASTLPKEVLETEGGAFHVEAFGQGDVSQASKALLNYGATINKIDREIDLARQALDQALAAYNEMQMAMPMHRKYREVINSLEKYRDHVKDVRREIDLYPASFLDVTTPACT